MFDQMVNALNGVRKPRAKQIKVGDIFGRLTATDVQKISDQRVRYRWCVCSCGNGHWAAESNLRKGSTKSCGCLRRELSRERAFKAREEAHKSLKNRSRNGDGQFKSLDNRDINQDRIQNG